MLAGNCRRSSRLNLVFHKPVIPGPALCFILISPLLFINTFFSSRDDQPQAGHSSSSSRNSKTDTYSLDDIFGQSDLTDLDSDEDVQAKSETHSGIVTLKQECVENAVIHDFGKMGNGFHNINLSLQTVYRTLKFRPKDSDPTQPFSFYLMPLSLFVDHPREAMLRWDGP